MKGSISGIFFLLFLVSFGSIAESQLNPGVILAVQNAMQRSNDALAAVNSISPGVTDGPLKEALKKCGESYFFASQNLERTIDDLKKGSFASAATLVDQALRDGSSCQAAPVAGPTAAFKSSCSQALSLVNGVKA